MINLIPWKKKRKEDSGGGLAPRDVNPMTSIQNEVNALFDRFRRDGPGFAPMWKGWPSQTDEFTPAGWAFDVDDLENEIVVRAEAPGFDPADFNVRVSAGQLILEAEHEEETGKGNGRQYHYGSFRRVYPLPTGVEDDKIEAKYHNGVLEVKVPKGEQAKAKRIEVKSE